MILYLNYRKCMPLNQLYWVEKGKILCKVWGCNHWNFDSFDVLNERSNILYTQFLYLSTSLLTILFSFVIDKYAVRILESFALFVKYFEGIWNIWYIFYFIVIWGFQFLKNCLLQTHIFFKKYCSKHLSFWEIQGLQNWLLTSVKS